MARGDPMLEWLHAPFSGAPAGTIASDVPWHARLMVLAWGLMIPAGALWARFCKVSAEQDWPRELNDKQWWRAHLGLAIGAVLLSMGAVTLVSGREPTDARANLHHLLGWTVLLAGLWQALHGLARGTEGGPTAATPRGDHFDRTLRRVLFERIHESLGWIAVLAAVAAILSGLWVTDAPRLMFAAVVSWWCLPSAASVHWQRAGRAFDTCQAIWGPDPALPGNRRAPVGWGVVRRPRGVAPMRADGRRARGKE